MKLQTNPELELAYDFIQYTNQNIFLTGKAGTGKTTFLKSLREQSPKRMVVVAPTGVAAINAGGVTIHSFFQISFGPQIPYDPSASRNTAIQDSEGVAAGIKRFSKEKINIIRSLDLLVIDEISMVRADLLDAIDGVLRRFKNRSKPFGGLQLLMIGDLQQLSPIVKDEEWDILKNYYDTAYFFSSMALAQSGFVPIELKEIFRQSDRNFIDLLNKVRENCIDPATIHALNERYIHNFQPDDEEGYITLTTHNYQSRQINEARLNKLQAKAHTFYAEVDGDFPEYAYPADSELILKTGAQVMFVKNDSSYEKRYYNGKIGKVTKIDEDFITVQCPGEEEPVAVSREEWQNMKYSLNEETQEIDEIMVGSFEQFPLKTAWAITIHKSQGLTFDKAIIDARQSFAHGQVYVALSRCKTLGGMVLRTPIEINSVKSDDTVLGFIHNAEASQPDQRQLDTARKGYQMMLLNELFDFKYLYNQAGYIVKLWNDHKEQLMGTLHDNLVQMLLPVQNEMIGVADKFSFQMNQLMQNSIDVETNPQLQERVKKASVYFSEKLFSLAEQPFYQSSFETDNKLIRKNITSAVDKLAKEIAIKKACLETVKNGFNLKSYLETRAKASVEEVTKGRSRPETADLSNLEYPDFYKQLRTWRNDKADALNVSLSRIISQKTMVDIANILPATRQELKAIKGMGGTKLQQFGKEILTMTITFRKSKGLEIPFDANKEIHRAALDTKEISLELFKNGMSIDDIARKRSLATSTIETHLTYFVGLGELNVFDVVEHEKVATIEKYIKENPGSATNEIKTALGDSYSYGEIRMVLNYLIRTKEQER